MCSTLITPQTECLQKIAVFVLLDPSALTPDPSEFSPTCDSIARHTSIPSNHSNVYLRDAERDYDNLESVVTRQG